ncbi:molybdopterin-containing oxidoreductase family protein [Tuwongella immobilis]|uniref:4Fe-4S Mo/W bis-MGD-type domain-containing protein n=1 Tax=Tuwongella immobilis TaxID=692036 RepID=A0A6C2YLH3_9BACT|nr:molybdopterin-dependent oxidoreductase [Tuwongella immobilis]VIP02217.1 oxidoreductase : Anaerobic dehydrogenase, typically selenocysteine-containing OS=Microcoleus sp. PCC 7113 GN=Mic7113_1638 PE=4 SV=1: Molybdop_Fe4S4: Molybdopterin: Molydop_binding [Tuwongella immobilis]VTS00738.1 oxidoreductase : Anaerobic dehydrogenase, typically selenocysteine-containing OS=Microcoleus sp. PCC 7113 GN=Mic7113_1638 PE=4 SV=1: Molybdop_Fe4S4: Molybdopterin: Molydop_binding [Tuwongella immobilis]
MSDSNSAGPNRRDWLRQAAIGSALLPALTIRPAAAADEPPAASSPASPDSASAPQPASPIDFTRDSAALAPDKIVDSACQFCNSNCGLKVHLKAGRVIAIHGRSDDPVQAGQICVKAEMMTELLANRRRLKTPMKRIGGKKGAPDSAFAPISWDEALTIIAQKWLALRDAGEAHTVVSRTSGRLPRGVGSLIHRLFTLLGSPNDTDVGPVCNDAGGNALATTFGLGNFTNGYGVDPATGREDLGSANYFLFFGTNQAETHPVTFAHLLRCRQQTGAKLVVIDPRKTPTASHADAWVAIKPHTDFALVLGMLREIIDRNWIDRALVDKWVIGYPELVTHLQQNGYTVDWAANVCDVPPAQIRQLAHDYAHAKPAAIFCNAGISHQVNAFDTYRAMTFLAAITGNIGVPGGGCNFMHNTWPGDLRLPALSASVPKITQPAMPVGPDWFAESILEGKPYRMKSLISMGNPLLSSSHTTRVAAAFSQLDFFVYTGLFPEESGLFADLLLPVCSGLEMDGVYMRRDDRAIRWQSAAVSRVGDAKPDWEIWIDLAHTLAKLDSKNPPEYWTNAFPLAWKDYRQLWQEFVQHTPAMQGMSAERMANRAEPLRWPCPHPQHPGVSTLYLDHPSWGEAMAALGHPGKRFPTPSGKIEIVTPEMDRRFATMGSRALPRFHTHPEVIGNLPVMEHRPELVPNPVHPHALTRKIAWRPHPSTPRPEGFPLMGMIGRPSVVHFAGVTQWLPTGKQRNGVRFIQMHPKTAEAAQLQSGDRVWVESPRGKIEGTLLIWEGIRPDTVFVPSTFGPAQSLGDEFDLPRYQSANHLTDDRYFDAISGQQAYKCFACRVTKA